MAHALSGRWRLRRLFTNGSGNPQEDDDGLFVLDIEDNGTKGPNGWKKKNNDADPGQDVDVKLKSNGNKHRIEITTTGATKTKYKGIVSDELSGGGKTVLVGAYDDNFNEGGNKRVKVKTNNGQDDGTWTGVRP